MLGASWKSMAQSLAASAVPLRVGSTVPNFSAETTQGRIDFYEQIQGNWVVLFSFPDNSNPVVTTELASFTELQSEFAERRVKLFAMSANNTGNRKGQFEPHGKWVKDIDEISNTPLLFTIISDTDRGISSAFNILDDTDADTAKAADAVGERLTLKSRNVFVIDDEKRLKLIFNFPAAVGLNTAEVLRVVDCLQTTSRADVRTPANWVPGRPVVVPPEYNDEAAKKKFPGFKGVKPYLRFYNLPEKKTNMALPFLDFGFGDAFCL